MYGCRALIIILFQMWRTSGRKYTETSHLLGQLIPLHKPGKYGFHVRYTAIFIEHELDLRYTNTLARNEGMFFGRNKDSFSWKILLWKFHSNPNLTLDNESRDLSRPVAWGCLHTHIFRRELMISIVIIHCHSPPRVDRLLAVVHSFPGASVVPSGR